MSLDQMFQSLWRDYTTLNPSILDIENVFTKRGDALVNDHVAFRTFNTPHLGINKFKSYFEKNGYVAKGEYHFAAKKLHAQHFEHPSGNHPKVFISELLIEQLSAGAQKIIQSLVAQVPVGFSDKENFCTSGRPWQVNYADYQTLLAESEYAAWLSAFGFRVNHFTVYVNALKTLHSIADVNTALKDAGFRLNTSGSEIKGSETIGLMQSSTLANPIPIKFADGEHTIPGCYYEFAQRFPVNGVLYGGFVEQSADKIFESTNVRA